MIGLLLALATACAANLADDQYSRTEPAIRNVHASDLPALNDLLTALGVAPNETFVGVDIRTKCFHHPVYTDLSSYSSGDPEDFLPNIDSDHIKGNALGFELCFAGLEWIRTFNISVNYGIKDQTTMQQRSMTGICCDDEGHITFM